MMLIMNIHYVALGSWNPESVSSVRLLQAFAHLKTTEARTFSDVEYSKWGPGREKGRTGKERQNGGISWLLGVAKLQSVPGSDNPNATPLITLRCSSRPMLIAYLFTLKFVWVSPDSPKRHLKLTTLHRHNIRTSLPIASVQENVCSKSKKRKKSRFFGFWKKTLKRK